LRALHLELFTKPSFSDFLRNHQDLEDQIRALEQQLPPRFEQKGGQE
jgi:hypothetical protein